jgi:hypothetical protein
VTPEEIESRFVLATLQQSGINNREASKAHINGEKHVFRNFRHISEIARAILGNWLILINVQRYLDGQVNHLGYRTGSPLRRAR